MPVMSFVEAQIPPERVQEVRQTYTEMLGRGVPTEIRETYLLTAEDGTTAIATVWRSHEELEAVRSSPEEPFARRVLREAGGDPRATFFDIIGEAPER